MKILRKEAFPQYITYTVDYDGMWVYARVADGVVIDSSFKNGTDSFLKLRDFVLNDFNNTL